ncbi:unnamed protein product, partial [Polarella glacialis]
MVDSPLTGILVDQAEWQKADFNSGDSQWERGNNLQSNMSKVPQSSAQHLDVMASGRNTCQLITSLLQPPCYQARATAAHGDTSDDKHCLPSTKCGVMFSFVVSGLPHLMSSPRKAGTCHTPARFHFDFSRSVFSSASRKDCRCTRAPSCQAQAALPMQQLDAVSSCLRISWVDACEHDVAPLGSSLGCCPLQRHGRLASGGVHLFGTVLFCMPAHVCVPRSCRLRVQCQWLADPVELAGCRAVSPITSQPLPALLVQSNTAEASFYQRQPSSVKLVKSQRHVVSAVLNFGCFGPSPNRAKPLQGAIISHDVGCSWTLALSRSSDCCGPCRSSEIGGPSQRNFSCQPDQRSLMSLSLTSVLPTWSVGIAHLSFKRGAQSVSHRVSRRPVPALSPAGSSGQSRFQRAHQRKIADAPASNATLAMVTSASWGFLHIARVPSGLSLLSFVGIQQLHTLDLAKYPTAPYAHGQSCHFQSISPRKALFASSFQSFYPRKSLFASSVGLGRRQCLDHPVCRAEAELPEVAVQLTMHLPSPDLCICRGVTPMTRKQFQNSTAAILNVRVMLMQRSARGEKLCIQPPAPMIPLVPALSIGVFGSQPMGQHHLLSSPSRAAYDPSVKSCSSGVSPLFSLQRAAARVLDTIDKAPSTDCALTGHLPARPVKMIFGRVGRFQESCPDMLLHPGSRRRLKGRAEIREAAAGNLGLALFFGCIAAADRERKKRLALHNMARASCSKPPPHCRPVTGGVQRVKGSAGPGTSQGLDLWARIFRIACSSGVRVQSRLQLGPVPLGSSMNVAPCVLSRPLLARPQRWRVSTASLPHSTCSNSGSSKTSIQSGSMSSTPQNSRTALPSKLEPVRQAIARASSVWWLSSSMMLTLRACTSEHHRALSRHAQQKMPHAFACPTSVPEGVGNACTKSCSHRVSLFFSLQRSTAMVLDTTDLTEAIRLLSGSQLTFGYWKAGDGGMIAQLPGPKVQGAWTRQAGHAHNKQLAWLAPLKLTAQTLAHLQAARNLMGTLLLGAGVTSHRRMRQPVSDKDNNPARFLVDSATCLMTARSEVEHDAAPIGCSQSLSAFGRLSCASAQKRAFAEWTRFSFAQFARCRAVEEGLVAPVSSQFAVISSGPGASCMLEGQASKVHPPAPLSCCTVPTFKSQSWHLDQEDWNINHNIDNNIKNDKLEEKGKATTGTQIVAGICGLQTICLPQVSQSIVVHPGQKLAHAFASTSLELISFPEEPPCSPIESRAACHRCHPQPLLTSLFAFPHCCGQASSSPPLHRSPCSSQGSRPETISPPTVSRRTEACKRSRARASPGFFPLFRADLPLPSGGQAVLSTGKRAGVPACREARCSSKKPGFRVKSTSVLALSTARQVNSSELLQMSETSFDEPLVAARTLLPAKDHLGQVHHLLALTATNLGHSAATWLPPVQVVPCRWCLVLFLPPVQVVPCGTQLHSQLAADLQLVPSQVMPLSHGGPLRCARQLRSRSLAVETRPLRPLGEGLPSFMPSQFGAQRLAAPQSAGQRCLLLSLKCEAARFPTATTTICREDLLMEELDCPLIDISGLAAAAFDSDAEPGLKLEVVSSRRDFEASSK